MSSKRQKVELVKQARTYHVSRDDNDSAIFDFLHALNCPRSLTVWLLYKNEEFQQLVDLDIEPNDYNCPFRFRDDYAATSFLSKSNFLPLEVSKKDAAFKKFFKFEELCNHTNRRDRKSVV